MTANTNIVPRYGYAPGAHPDVKLAYADWGPENANPEATIVAVHGITANLKGWNPLAERLVAKGFRVITYDLRGRGESSKPASGYNLTNHSFDLVAILDYFKLPTANIFGHSLGAAISVYFSAHYPTRVRRVILLDGGAPFPDDTFAAIARSMDRLGQVYPSLENYVAQFKASPYWPEWSDYIEQYYVYDAAVNPDGTVMSKVPKAAAFEEKENLLRINHYLATLHTLITAPTLILRAPMGLLNDGKAGFILSVEGTAQAVKSINAPARQVEVENTNHFTILISEGAAQDTVVNEVVEHFS
jgi:pimeloyl-ACP methyl ester carboxylesterase